MGICHSYTPDGRCVSLLKILLTNVCIYDCRYCINRISSDTERARFTPAEVVELTMDFYRRNYIEGLFLSSGILKSADYTMEQVIEVARSLREEHSFAGYIHLKAAPGASDVLLRQAASYADRLSCNVELPTVEDLARLAPEKRELDIETTMSSLHATEAEARADKRSRSRARRRVGASILPAGQSTQMVVGATPTNDAKILSRASDLYSGFRMRRVYYSAYSPTRYADSFLPSLQVPLVREHRLYQADWLLRFYGFEVDEITPEDVPMLDLDIDPKLAWALRHRELFPIDLNTASRQMLLRVPGLGQRNVARIVKIRRRQRLRTTDLKALRLNVRKVLPFIEAADSASEAVRKLDRLDLRRFVKQPKQLELFAAGVVARTGEL